MTQARKGSIGQQEELSSIESIRAALNKNPRGKRYRYILFERLQTAFTHNEIDTKGNASLTEDKGQAFATVWGQAERSVLLLEEKSTVLSSEFVLFAQSDLGKNIAKNKFHKFVMLEQVPLLYWIAYKLDLADLLLQKQLDASQYSEELNERQQNFRRLMYEMLPFVQHFRDLQNQVEEYKQSSSEEMTQQNATINNALTEFTGKVRNQQLIGAKIFNKIKEDIAHFQRDLILSQDEQKMQDAKQDLTNRLKRLQLQFSTIRSFVTEQKEWLTSPVFPQELNKSIINLQKVYRAAVENNQTNDEKINEQLINFHMSEKKYQLIDIQKKFLNLFKPVFSSQSVNYTVHDFKEIKKNIIKIIDNQYNLFLYEFGSMGSKNWNPGVTNIIEILCDDFQKVNDVIEKTQKKLECVLKTARKYLEEAKKNIEKIDCAITLLTEEKQNKDHLADKKAIAQLRQNMDDVYEQHKKKLDQIKKDYFQSYQLIQEQHKANPVVKECDRVLIKLNNIDVQQQITINVQKTALQKRAQTVHVAQETQAMAFQLAQQHHDTEENEEEKKENAPLVSQDNHFTLPSPTPLVIGSGTAGLLGVGIPTFFSIAKFVLNMAILGFMTSNPISWAVGILATSLLLLTSSIVWGVKATNRAKKNELLQSYPSNVQEDLFQRNESLKKAGFSSTTRHLMMRHGIKVKEPTSVVHSVQALAKENEVVCEIVNQEKSELGLFLNKKNGYVLFKKKLNGVISHIPVTKTTNMQEAAQKYAMGIGS